MVNMIQDASAEVGRHPESEKIKFLTQSSIVEDYLSLIYILDRDRKKASISTIADAFRVSPPTVTVTIQRMERDGWVIKDEKRLLHLSHFGYQAARYLLRRRMLVEWMLVRLLSIPWSRLYVEAHRMEHAFSEQLTQKIAELTGNPVTCPYGNPFPGHEASVANWKRLIEAKKDSTGILRRVHEEVVIQEEALVFLETKQLFPGSPVQIQRFDTLNGVISLETNQNQVNLGIDLAKYIFFEETSGD